MKYQKNIPATKPNKVHIPDQKTLTAKARVIIKKGCPDKMPEHPPTWCVELITCQRHG